MIHFLGGVVCTRVAVFVYLFSVLYCVGEARDGGLMVFSLIYCAPQAIKQDHEIRKLQIESKTRYFSNFWSMLLYISV